MNNGWVWIRTTFATAGIEYEHGYVSKAAPIFKYMVGWDINRVKDYLNNRGILQEWIVHEEEGK